MEPFPELTARGVCSGSLYLSARGDSDSEVCGADPMEHTDVTTDKPDTTSNGLTLSAAVRAYKLRGSHLAELKPNSNGDFQLESGGNSPSACYSPNVSPPLMARPTRSYSGDLSNKGTVAELPKTDTSKRWVPVQLDNLMPPRKSPTVGGSTNTSVSNLELTERATATDASAASAARPASIAVPVDTPDDTSMTWRRRTRSNSPPRKQLSLLGQVRASAATATVSEGTVHVLTMRSLQDGTAVQAGPQ